MEPPRILAMGTQGPKGQWGEVDFKRGDVKKVDEDKSRSKLG